MQVKLHLTSGAEVTFKTQYVTIEGFMEDLALMTSGVFNKDGKHMSKYGDFIDFHYGPYIRYDSILLIDEVTK